jgi:hypothetical protein
LEDHTVQDDLRKALEATSLCQVLTSLADLCYQEADRLQGQPGQKKVAREWRHAARQIDNLVNRLPEI